MEKLSIALTYFPVTFSHLTLSSLGNIPKMPIYFRSSYIWYLPSGINFVEWNSNRHAYFDFLADVQNWSTCFLWSKSAVKYFKMCLKWVLAPKSSFRICFDYTSTNRWRKTISIRKRFEGCHKIDKKRIVYLMLCLFPVE
jgi:hypothetical protein